MILFLAALANAEVVADASDDACITEDGQDCVWQDETLIDITDDVEVKGEIVKPHVAMWIEPTRPGFHPLIRVRASFNEELATSIDEVK